MAEDIELVAWPDDDCRLDVEVLVDDAIGRFRKVLCGRRAHFGAVAVVVAGTIGLRGDARRDRAAEQRGPDDATVVAIDFILESTVARLVRADEIVEDDAFPIGKNKTLPYDKSAILSEGGLAVVSSDDLRALGN